MKMNHKLSLLAAGVVLGMSAGVQAAVIDDFSTNQTLTLNDPAGSMVSGSVSGSGILGGQRDVWGMLTQAAAVSDDAAFEVAGGELNVSNKSQVASTWQIQWDGDDSGDASPTSFEPYVAGGGSLPPATWPALGDGLGLAFNLSEDWSDQAAIVVTVTNSDLGFDFQITLFSGDPDDGDLAWATVSLAANDLVPGGTLIEPISLNAFRFCSPYVGSNPPSDGVNYISCFGTLNMADISAVVVDIDTIFDAEGGNGDTSTAYGSFRVNLDLTIDQAETVPEPGTIALLGMGLLAAGGVAGKRRRKAQA